jgi:flagellar biosynthesis GTPase FlhF
MENQRLEYPSNFNVMTEGITEEERRKLGVKEAIKIRGVGIVPTVSRNGIKYEMSEIAKSWGTINGEIVTMNHTNDVTDAVALITLANVNERGEGIYEAIAYNTSKHPDTVQMIQRGLIKYVSIEANAGQLIQEGDDVYTAKNLEFTGLAFVRTAGVKETTVGIAESFEHALKNKTGGKTMEQPKANEGAAPSVPTHEGATPVTKEEAKPEPAAIEPAKEQAPAAEKEEQKPEVTEQKGEQDRAGEQPAEKPQESAVNQLTEEVNRLKAQLEEMKKVQESHIAEVMKKAIENKGDALHVRPLAEKATKQKMLENVDISNLTIADILRAQTNK